MDKNRTEAFSDGVIAIIITIMVLEHARVTAEGRQHDDAGIGMHGADRHNRLEPILDRHLEVHQRHVRLRARRKANG